MRVLELSTEVYRDNSLPPQIDSFRLETFHYYIVQRDRRKCLLYVCSIVSPVTPTVNVKYKKQRSPKSFRVFKAIINPP